MNEPKGFQTLQEHFRQQGWRFQIYVPDRVLGADFNCKNGSVRCIAMIDLPDDCLEVVAVLPVAVPADKRQAVAELAMRSSCGMKIGSFELDFDRGEVRFHGSTCYPTGAPGPTEIQRLIGVSLIAADTLFPALMSVIYGNASPSEALQRVRSTLSATPKPEPARESEAAPRFRFN